MRTGDFVVQRQYAEQSVQLEAENWRLRSTTVVHGVSGELDEENWRLFVVQLYYAEYLWSWMVRTGDFLVQL